MAVCGGVLVYQGLPVARSALQAQRADAVVTQLRRAQDISPTAVSAGVSALSAAVDLDPVATRYLERSELEGGAALKGTLKISPEEYKTRLLRTKADLQIALAAAPARSIDWMRLAVTRQALDGTSREIVPLFQRSIDTGPWIEPMFPMRLRLIVDNWGYLTEEQKTALGAYVSQMWRHSSDQRYFASTVGSPVDEVIIRNLLKDEPGAQELLTKWILAYNKI